MGRKGAFNFNLAVKTFLILLAIGIGLLYGKSHTATVAGLLVLGGLGFFVYMAWGN